MIPRIFVQRIDWNGITVEVSYEPEWLGGLAEAFGEPLARLQIQSVSPERAALPVTETGYRSLYVINSVIMMDGGPVTFVRGWLDAAADDPAWKRTQDASRQLALF